MATPQPAHPSQMANPVQPSLSTKLNTLFNKAKDTVTQAAGQAQQSIPQHPAIDSIQHQLRSFQQHYIPLPGKSLGPTSLENTKALQWAITSQKGVALDFLSVSRDGTLASKELYEWGQGLEEADLVDATDRMAYLSFMAAQLSGDLARQLDDARTPLKELRNLQKSIDSKTYILKEVIAKKKTPEDEISLMSRDLTRLQESLPLKRREAIVKSNELTWKAYTEYSSKLMLLSHASSLLVPTLASNEWDKDYASHVRSSAQTALEGYAPGKYIQVTNWPEGGLSASFGETHSIELSHISRDPHSGIPTTSRSDSLPSDIARLNREPQSKDHFSSPTTQHANPFDDLPVACHSTSPPLNVGQLNLSPVQLPVDVLRSPSVGLKGLESQVGAQDGLTTGRGVAPTVAETGVPVFSGTDGPGPVSGTFEKRSSSSNAQQDLEAARAALAPQLPPRHGSPPDSSALSTSNLPTTSSFPPAPMTDRTETIEAQAREQRFRRGSETDQLDEQRRTKESEAAGGLPGYSI